ncbi:MAG: acyl-coenzyme A thioesterase PaaI-like protein, partial [Gammaproteobacteria bacterium]
GPTVSIATLETTALMTRSNKDDDTNRSSNEIHSNAHSTLPAFTITGHFDEFVSLRLVKRSLGSLELSTEFVNSHLNGGGLVHGAFVMAALDVAMASAAAVKDIHDPRLFGVTLSMTKNFVAPIPPALCVVAAMSPGTGAVPSL